MQRLLPIAQYEARRFSLGRRPQRVRLAAVAVVGLLYLSIHAERAATMFGPSLVGSGRPMLAAAAWLNYVLALVAAISVAATSVSNDRQAGTLPLLIAADVRPSAYLMGRIFALAFGIGLLFLTELPLLAGPLFFGGVTRSQFFGAVMLCVSAASLWTAVGLFISVLSRSNKTAIAATTAAVLLVEATGPLAERLAAWWSLPPKWRPTVLSLSEAGVVSTAVRLREVLSPNPIAAVTPFILAQFGVAGTMLVAAFAAAGPMFARSAVDIPKIARGGGRRSRRWRTDAVAAKEFRLVLGGWGGVSARLLFYAVFTIGSAWFAVRGGASRPVAGLLSLATIGGIATIDGWRSAAAIAGREIAERTLPTLVLCEPSTPSLIWRKLIGLLAFLIPPVAAAAGVFAWAPDSLADPTVASTAVLACGVVGMLWSASAFCSLSSPTLGWAAALALLVIAAAVAAPAGLLLVFMLGADAAGPAGWRIGAAYFCGAVAMAFHVALLTRLGPAASRT